ncbi:hypothetical protein F5Y16DRAFT_327103 [Xylariaceae sp. FL0255]|nr:hypothetical protein F5Y16DRAFT_327103 [Xylariaceae sp. FL0255]
MKNTLTLLALAAGLSQVNADSFIDASQFSCPGNTDNKCTSQMSSGWDWSDLNVGSFSSYSGFEFSGWTCQDSFDKRDSLFGRDFQSKCITGVATQDTGSCPSIKCGSGTDKASWSTFQVTPDHDCDLEFHYSMPDGSTCKQRNSCKKTGTVVTNSQCGGATGVTVVYPSQPDTGKSSCSVGIHSMSYYCASASPTVTHTYPVSTYSAKTTTTTSIPQSYPVYTPSSSSSSSPATSTTPSSTYTVVPYSTTTPIGYNTSPLSSSSSGAVSTYSTTPTTMSTYIASSTTTSTPAASSTTTSTPAAASSTSISTSTMPYNVSPYSSSSTPATLTTTSTPAASSTTTSSSAAVSTTTSPGYTVSSYSSSSTAATSTYTVGTTTYKVSSGTTTTTTSAYPTETLSCPGVVPSCLNTWMYSVGCKDNTEASCYCPDSSYISNVYECLYAHGESDEIISEAISYIQGLCAPYVSSNPGIATAPATITSYLTVSATSTIASPTVVTVQATTVVPCTDSEGLTITGSSTTVTISTAMTVPQVVFTTVTAATTGAGSSSSPAVVIVPGSVTTALPTSTAATYSVSAYSSFATSPVSGSSPTSTPGAIPTAGAAQLGSGLGFMGIVAFAVAAL